MRYRHLLRNSVKFKLVILIVLIINTCTKAALYAFGPAVNDEMLIYSSWDKGSTQIQLLADVFMFGDGSISAIWINSFGSISLNSSTTSRIANVQYNIIFAPFFSRSQQGPFGEVFYKQSLNDSGLFENVSRDISTYESDTGATFYPTFVLKVTWSNISSVNDTEKINSFQAILATDSVRTYLIYNYLPIQWTSANGSFALAGIHVAGENMQLCSHFLEGSGSSQIRLLSSTSSIVGIRGRHVIDITDPLVCTTAFKTLCDTFPRTGRGAYQPLFELSSDGDKEFDFFLKFTCKPGLVIEPSVTSRRIECSYDSDYYEFAWEQSDAPRCIDLNTTFTFFTSMEVANRSLSFIASDRLSEVNTQMISRILENVNVTDVAVGMEPPRSNYSNHHTIIEFTTYVPPFTNRKLTSKTLAEKLMEELKVANISVTDMTSTCLQSCLCRNLKDPVRCRGKGKPLVPPDACCGECGGPQKAYASSLKACCNNSILYDPNIAVCCNGRIRKGSTCPNRRS